MDLAAVCSVDLVAFAVIGCGASIGLKLRRVGLLPGLSDGDVCAAAAAAAQSAAALDANMAGLHILAMNRDCPDEALVHLSPQVPLTPLLRTAAARNFHGTSLLLLERRADLHHVDVRRGRRRSLVDTAARGASLDGDWRLTLHLLRAGARPEGAQGVLFAPLRRGDAGLARQLVALKVLPDTAGLVSLLCDVCAHGATESAALLIDELGVPVNARNERDCDTCTDRATAWHCWETAEWLVTVKGGAPAKPSTALGHLLDASGDSTAERVLKALRAAGAVGLREHLAAVVQRGDLQLCEALLQAEASPSCSAGAATLAALATGEPPFVDLALCHGHLRVAAALLRRGLRARDLEQALADVRLHTTTAAGAGGGIAEEVLRLLPRSRAGTPDFRPVSAPRLPGFEDDDDRTPIASGHDSYLGVGGAVPMDTSTSSSEKRPQGPLLGGDRGQRGGAGDDPMDVDDDVSPALQQLQLALVHGSGR